MSQPSMAMAVAVIRFASSASSSTTRSESAQSPARARTLRKGALGFDEPRLVVQVKSGDVVADQPALQGLLGCIQDTHADFGLLVSWSGFTSAVRQRTNDLFFRVRLWGRDEILDALFSVYERLPESIRADLPLQRIWTLVDDSEAS